MIISVKKDDGDISAYIRNAECIIQNGCTSAMESYISNVPVINYVPINSKNQIFGEFIKKISHFLLICTLKINFGVLNPSVSSHKIIFQSPTFLFALNFLKKYHEVCQPFSTCHF